MPLCSPGEVNHIALYGGLRRGEPAYYDFKLDQHLRYEGPCRIRGILLDLGDYPGVIEQDDGVVVGDVFSISDARVLEALDDFECFDASKPHESLYLRKKVPLMAPRVESWVYVYNQAQARQGSHSPTRIESGDWLAYRQSSSVSR